MAAAFSNPSTRAQTWQCWAADHGADIHKVAVSPQNRALLLANGRSGPFQKRRRRQ